MRYMLVIVNRYHTMSLRANQLPVLPCGVLFNSPSSDLTDWAARGQRDARCALMLLVKDHRPGTFVVKNHRPGICREEPSTGYLYREDRGAWSRFRVHPGTPTVSSRVAPPKRIDTTEVPGRPGTLTVDISRRGDLSENPPPPKQKHLRPTQMAKRGRWVYEEGQ